MLPRIARENLPPRRARSFVALAFVACLAPLLLVGALRAETSATSSSRPLREVIDANVQAAWKQENLQPAPRADDATFLRRVSLDLTGTIPTAAEARQFLDDKDAEKRARLVERLLADSRFAQQQATLWDLILFGRNPANPDATRKRDYFRQWLAGKFAANVPFDHWVRALLLAEEDGAELFYVQFQNRPEDLTEAFSRIFLGTQLQCARCHDHPNTDL